jgi:hypothetical protein
MCIHRADAVNVMGGGVYFATELAAASRGAEAVNASLTAG